MSRFPFHRKLLVYRTKSRTERRMYHTHLQLDAGYVNARASTKSAMFGGLTVCQGSVVQRHGRLEDKTLCSVYVLVNRGHGPRPNKCGRGLRQTVVNRRIFLRRQIPCPCFTTPGGETRALHRPNLAHALRAAMALDCSDVSASRCEIMGARISRN
jgi:hypothetical protein